MNAPNVVTHPRFDRAPVISKRRRGRLPPGVVRIESVLRLHVGALAEILGSRSKANAGIRVRVLQDDPSQSPSVWEVESLGRDIACEDGSLARSAMFRDARLRRVWTGLSERERIQLRLLRGAS